MHIAELCELEHRWRQSMQHQAGGGRYAMAGFHYQLLSTLLQTVQRFVADNGATAQSVIAECLSDIRSIDGDTVVITQVKRRQTGRSVRAALDELWMINQLAADLPGLREDLRFKIQAAASELVSVSAVIDSWRSRQNDTAALDDFVARVEVEMVTDPGRELHALLHEQLKAPDPVGLARRWVARLMEGTASDNGFYMAAQEIWNDLASLHVNRHRQIDFQLWRDEDTEPSVVERGDYLTGQQPMLFHLRKGFFADRPAALRKVEDAFLDWASSKPAFQDNTVRLPIFWIGGRSGAGKSVLLLQFLSRLHADGVARILWLGSNTQLLPRAVDWVERSNVNYYSPERYSVIAIDDPYQVTTSTNVVDHWQQVLGMVEDLRQDGEGDRLPLVVCCGPTEQAVRLNEDFFDRIALTLSILDNESVADYEHLHAWFVQRAGRAAPATEPNQLLVQLFFEWHHGVSLREFAFRFRNRLNNMDSSGHIEDAVTRILTLNRLYAGYPLAALDDLLDPAQQDRLETLQRQEHLEVRNSGVRQGMWIAHPHLANHIYETWYPRETSRKTRINHLLQVVRDCGNHGTDPASRNSALWALSRVLKDQTGDICDRVSRDEISHVLTISYIQRVSEDTPLSLADLPVWIELAALLPQLNWVPHPLAEAIELVRESPVTAKGLRLTCHKLLQYAASSLNVSDVIVNLLERTIRWHEWHPIMLDALRTLKDAPLDAVILKRIHEFNTDIAAAGIYLSQALRRSAPTEELVAFATSLLREAPATVHWGDVAVALFRRDPRIHLPDVVHWLRGHSECPEVVFLLKELFLYAINDSTEMRNEIFDIAERWTALNYLESSANFILEPLLRQSAPRAALARRAASWLALGVGDRSYITELLVRKYGQFRLGIGWLRIASTSHPSYHFVLAALLDDLDNRQPELVAECPACARDELDSDIRTIEVIALKWVGEDLDSDAWPTFWRRMWRTGRNASELAALAIRWLACHPEQKSAMSVWTALERIVNDSSEVVREGYMLAFAEALSTADSSIVPDSVGIEWLAGNGSHSSWPYVWSAMWTFGIQRQQLIECGSSWLEHNPFGVCGWHLVWEHLLLNENARATAISMLAVSRLTDTLRQEGDPIREQWYRVWRSLWYFRYTNDIDRSKLRELVIGWLSVNPPPKAWWPVWERLWQTGARNLRRTEVRNQDGLWDPALRYLSNPDHDSWHLVWQSLWQTGRRRAVLRDLAESWLPHVPQSERRWQIVQGWLQRADASVSTSAGQRSRPSSGSTRTGN